jgi:tetratricopeptide (TPR) repeat protein
MAWLKATCLSLLLFAATLSAATVEQAEALLVARDPGAPAAIAGLLKAQPRSADAWVLQARLLLQQESDSKAVDAARKAVDLGPENARAWYWLGNAYGYRIGRVGMVSKAMIAPKLRDAFERALELDPDLHDARNSLVEYYLQAPAMAGGSVEKARAHAAELARRDPPRGHYARGRLAMHDGDSAAATRAFVAAYQGRPENKTYRMAAGIAYQQEQQWAEAFELFSAWTKEDPSATGAWYQLGRIAAQSGQYLPEGTQALRRFLALPAARGEPPRHHAWYRLGQIQVQAGDKDAARISFEQALKGEPGNADFKAALAAL